MHNSEFMNKKGKSLVLKDWINFFSNGFKFKHFTNRLYKHLVQHCSFIAHYDRDGFFFHYFADPLDIKRFLKQFDEKYDCCSTEIHNYGWIENEYSDINNLMVKKIKPYLRKFYLKLENEYGLFIENKINSLHNSINNF